MSRRASRRRKRTQWQSLVRYLRFRLVIPVFRSQHAPEYTARGVANGVFWGLTPTVGLQTLEIAATWFVGRTLFRRDSSLLQGFIWVWVNNPVTMIPMYYAFYVTGLVMTGNRTQSTGYAGFVDLWTRAAAMGWREGFVSILTAIGVPLFVGAAPYAAAGAIVSYRWAVSVVRARHRRLRRAA